jgi:hypothetical protein
MGFGKMDSAIWYSAIWLRAPQINSPWHHIVLPFITELLINCEVVLSYRSCMKGKEEQVENKNVFEKHHQYQK